MIRLLAIRVIDRIKESGNTQKVLTEHSGMIITRLGFHELNEQVCSREGSIILQLKDDNEGYEILKNDLNKIYGIDIKEMVLCGKSDKHGPVPEGARIILAALRIDNRREVVNDLQKILSLFGCSIRTRLGINLDNNSESGLIVLELTGDIIEINRLASRLSELENACSGLIWFE